MGYLFIPFLVALIVSLVLTPISIRLAKRYGAMDSIESRKVHRIATPRWGGIGLVGGFFVGLIAFWIYSPWFQNLLTFKFPIVHDGDVRFTLVLSEQLCGILMGTFILFVMGLVDDRRPVKAGMKFLIQIIASFVAMIYGVRIYGLSIPGFEAYAHFPVFITMVVTVLWLVGLTNAVNLIDGLDGLAAGVVSIIVFAFLGVALVQGTGNTLLFSNQMKLATVIASALLGGLLGFLVFNFHPARVFMGDSGSLVLGFLIGCLAVIGTFKTTILAVLLVPFILVAVPIADMTFAFSRRLLNKKNPFAPDRQHFHHRLLDAGWTQREVVLLVYVITLILGVISLTMVGIRK